MYTLHIFSLFSLFFIFFSFGRSGVSFHFWTNFTTHFILSGSTYKSLNKKNILKDLHKFHRCYLTPVTIWHVNVCTCMLKILWVWHTLKGWCCWWCCWWMLLMNVPDVADECVAKAVHLSPQQQEESLTYLAA